MKPHIVLKGVLWPLLSAPLIWLAGRIVLEVQQTGSGLGADPGEAVVHFLGEWALIMLLVGFTVTPLRQLTGFSPLARARRLVGLFAFAYVLLHALAYTAFYLEFSLPALLEDFVERAYITAGMASLVILSVMALTSTRGWQRRLRHNWRRLHQGIFIAIGLAIVHLWWLTKDGYGEVALFALWFGALVAQRLWWRRRVSSNAGAGRQPQY